MRAVKSVSIDSERRVIITFLDGSTETLYPNCIWCDAEALKEIIKELLEEKADAVVQTINNVAVASFEDGADEALIRKLIVSIEPIQEGTGDPSPENVIPISGRTGLSLVRSGKNLVDDSIKRTNAANTTVAIGGGSGDYHLFLHPGIYTLSCKFADGVHYSALCKETSGSQITIWSTTGTDTNASFTISKAGLYRLWFYRSSADGGVSADNVYDVLLELGSEATEYEPYKGSTYSVNWETEAGTVYGGTLDVVSGKLMVDRVKETKTWGELTNASTLTEVIRKKYALSATPKYITAQANGDLICNLIKTYSTSYSQDTVHMYIGDVNSAYVFLPADTDGSTVIELSYTIANPIEYQVTPQEVTTLLGTNNIWADSGNILELEYVADTKLYIGESQSGTLGSGKQTISNLDLQPVSEKTVEDLTEAVKDETAEKVTQEETENERGE